MATIRPPRPPRPPSATPPKPPVPFSVPLGASGRPPRPTRPALRSKGPRVLHANTITFPQGGAGEPPAGFVGAHTSRDEWLIYWALAKITGTPTNPRIGPFTGGTTWGFQAALDGGRFEPGGQVVDFVYDGPAGKIGMRVQSDFFHTGFGAGKQAKDLLLKANVSRFVHLIDLYSIDFVEDASGRAAISVVSDALKGIGRPDPVMFGRARQAVRRVAR